MLKCVRVQAIGIPKWTQTLTILRLTTYWSTSNEFDVIYSLCINVFQWQHQVNIFLEFSYSKWSFVPIYVCSTRRLCYSPHNYCLSRLAYFAVTQAPVSDHLKHPSQGLSKTLSLSCASTWSLWWLCNKALSPPHPTYFLSNFFFLNFSFFIFPLSFMPLFSIICHQEFQSRYTGVCYSFNLSTELKWKPISFYIYMYLNSSCFVTKYYDSNTHIHALDSD